MGSLVASGNCNFGKKYKFDYLNYPWWETTLGFPEKGRMGIEKWMNESF